MRADDARNRLARSAPGLSVHAKGLSPMLCERVDRNGFRGKVGAVGIIDGERYYWLVGDDDTVSMVPHSALIETETA